MNEKPELIIQKTIEIVAENGFHNSPTSLISQRAGVGVGTLYRYFDNKEKLIEHAHHYIKQGLMESIFKTDDDTLPARDRFIRIFTNIAHYLVKNESHHRFMEQFYYSPFGRDHRRIEKEDSLFAIFFDFLKHQHLIKDMDNEILFAISLGPLLFALKDHFAGYLVLDETIISEIVTASWDALKL